MLSLVSPPLPGCPGALGVDARAAFAGAQRERQKVRQASAAALPRVARRQGAAADAAQAVAGVWQADALHAGGGARVVASGHALLDAELPGGGWPLGALTELLQPVEGAAPLWPLLLPALAAHRHARGPGAVVALVGAPQQPYLPALAAAGLPPERMLWIPGGAPATQLWAAEQALRCADVAVVLAWLPRARSADLRRLHLAAAQRGDGLLFGLRSAAVAHEASPAPLRLRLAPGTPLTQDDRVAASLQLHIVKRRGPPLSAPVLLPAYAAPLRALLAAHAQPAAPEPGSATVLSFATRVAPTEGGGDHALDRFAVAA